MTAKQNFNLLLATKVISAFNKRNIDGYYCETKQEALNKALELIEENSTVTWGGSQTIYQIGLVDAVSKGNYQVFNRDTANTIEEKQEISRKAFYCDYYLASCNAVSEDGKLINIDGTSNRVAAIAFGPQNVILVVGMNKVEKDEVSAVNRARNRASVMNSLRLGVNTPCVKTGTCHDCTSEDCICCQIVITRMSRIKNRIKVILVGEDLGF